MMRPSSGAAVIGMLRSVNATWCCSVWFLYMKRGGSGWCIGNLCTVHSIKFAITRNTGSSSQSVTRARTASAMPPAVSTAAIDSVRAM